MTQPDGGYDLRPEAPPPTPPTPPETPAPKPGEPGWVPPVPIIEKADPQPAEPPPDPDVEQNKGMAILAYICFLIPLLAAPKSKFARFHANQGLLTFITWCAALVIIFILWGVQTFLLVLFKEMAAIYFFFSCLLTLVQWALLPIALGLTLYGMIQAANGERKHLPLFGQITFIK